MKKFMPIFLIFFSSYCMYGVPALQNMGRARPARFVFSSDEAKIQLALFRDKMRKSNHLTIKEESAPNEKAVEVSLPKELVAKGILYSA